MTWEIVAGLIVLVGCFISVGTLVWKLAAAVNRLECAVNSLREWVEKQSDKNKEFYEKLGDHEKRISLLEREDKYDHSV